MKTQLKIKVCGMRQQDNIRDVALLKPDYMGFIFYEKSARFVGTSLSGGSINQLNKHTTPVGVFVNESIDELIKKCQTYSINHVQLHGNETPSYCEKIKEAGLVVIKAFGMHDQFDFTLLGQYLNSCDYFLFDTQTKYYGGSGKTFNWDLLENYSYNKPYFLSGGISVNNAAELLSSHLPQPPFAIDINSKFETSPGIKNPDLIRQFLEIVQIDKHA